ncbi:mucin-5AC-like [Ptychodera flava]|uniref:mucin-5AC-like n=1 Tax=Ptychodera flava TaxID=63121 RepID=UPI00396A1B16
MGRVSASFVTLMVIINGALCQNETCQEWTEWMDDENGGTLDQRSIGEFELINQLRGPYGFCDEPSDIECALDDDAHTPYNETGQVSLACNLERGFLCFHSQQSGDCFNYAIRLSCPQPCPTARPTTLAATPDGAKLGEADIGVTIPVSGSPLVSQGHSATTRINSTTFSGSQSTSKNEVVISVAMVAVLITLAMNWNYA